MDRRNRRSRRRNIKIASDIKEIFNVGCDFLLEELSYKKVLTFEEKDVKIKKNLTKTR